MEHLDSLVNQVAQDWMDSRDDQQLLPLKVNKVCKDNPEPMERLVNRGCQEMMAPTVGMEIQVYLDLMEDKERVELGVSQELQD